ncbi:unnamed protein product [Vicia faba]|uniref:RRM domain-containing protein n=1 Tax=Vicia faba TaxID=3906 RepID=A0AAV1A6A7_VICFA|nr:unnamed protein product [Vicia faba]
MIHLKVLLLGFLLKVQPPNDLFPLFDKYSKVVDTFIPKDRRTGDSRGFAFVCYKYDDEASKAVDWLGEKKLHKLVIKSKINETKDVMKRKANEIDKSKVSGSRICSEWKSYRQIKCLLIKEIHVLEHNIDALWNVYSTISISFTEHASPDFPLLNSSFGRWHFGHSHHDEDHHLPQPLKDEENIFRLGFVANIALAIGKAFTGYL